MARRSKKNKRELRSLLTMMAFKKESSSSAFRLAFDNPKHATRFFKKYSILLAYEEIGKKPKPNANHVECSFDNMPGEDQFCQVKTSELITGPCTEDNHYGFDKGKPCILIKLNKVSSSAQR